jgi:hypothetical protein
MFGSLTGPAVSSVRPEARIADALAARSVEPA